MYLPNCDVWDAIYDNRDFVFTVPLTYCVNRLGIAFCDYSGHPLTKAVKEIMDIGIRGGIECLKEWYHINTFENWEDALRIKRKKEVRNNLEGMKLFPPELFRLPWEGIGFISHKTALYGPVKEEICMYEATRLESLYESIKSRGWSREYESDPIRGYALINGNDFRFVIKGGQHRVAVMAALGYENVGVTWQPGWVRTVIKNESCLWPYVRNGFVPESLAINIFIDFFSPN